MTDQGSGPIGVSTPAPSPATPVPHPNGDAAPNADESADAGADAGGAMPDIEAGGTVEIRQANGSGERSDRDERAGNTGSEASGVDSVSVKSDAAAAAGDYVDDDEPVSTAQAGPVPATEEYRMALVASVTVDLPNPHPTVVLRETESPRRQLSFSIGFQDATVLSHAMRRIPTPRPLTHELVSGILQGFDIDVVAVRLVGRQGAVYFAELDLRGRSGRSVHSCRPSDALTIALFQPVPVPILIDQRLLEDLGDVTPPGPGSA